MKVFETANEAKLTSQDRLAYQKSLQDYRDLHNSLKTSFKDGKLEGKIEGKIEGNIEGETKKAKQVAINLIEKGFDDEFICEVTKLSIFEVKKIRKELKK